MSKSLTVVWCLIVVSYFQAWGLDFHMDTSSEDMCGQLSCSLKTNTTDRNVFSIIDITLYDISLPKHTIKLASVSVGEPDVYVDGMRKMVMDVCGSVTQNHATLDITFSVDTLCQLATYLCEITYINPTGHADKMQATVSAKVRDNISKHAVSGTLQNTVASYLPPDKAISLANATDQLIDTMDRLTDTTIQLTDAKIQLTDTTNMLAVTANQLTNSSSGLEETLSNLGHRLANIETILTNHSDRLETMETILTDITNRGDQLAAMQSILTNMSSLLEKVLQEKPEQNTPTPDPSDAPESYLHKTCYKGMVSLRLPARVPVKVLNSREALCDTETDGGGWIVIQRRTTGQVDFYRGWEDYKNGFGNVTNDYWLGNEIIHHLTTSENYELRVDLTYKGKNYYAEYSIFRVGSESSNYQLSVGVYTGNAGDALGYHNNMAFSTKDRDNDLWSDNCAEQHTGAWWYKICHSSNLNGKWGDSSFNGVAWKDVIHSGSVASSEMKIRHY